jgi:arabinogalactan endo-1,4-beta-galactosidase
MIDGTHINLRFFFLRREERILILCILGLASFFACKKDVSQTTVATETHETDRISAVDLSFYPSIKNEGFNFLDSAGNEIYLPEFLLKKGVNTVRIRLWVKPISSASSLSEVKAFAEILRAKGLNIWLCLHYSDSWADPGQQVIPENWRNISYAAIKDSLRNYTHRVITQIKPEIVQIGNEVNNGFLHPYGKLDKNPQQFKELLGIAISEVRASDPACEIMIHFAGVNSAKWFYNQISTVDFDLIGLSYYPLWHGLNLSEIENNLYQLSQDFTQKIIIAECAYPFTLNWNDWTNNVVGLAEQLILPEYPATMKGQLDFLAKIRKIILTNPNGLGFCYWGGEMVAFRGDTASDGSPWENQALFDFNDRAVPAWTIFNLDNFVN